MATKTKDYYSEIVNYIEDLEVNKRVRELKDNYDTLLTYWNIGKSIVEAQGGKSRAKYGDSLIKSWGEKLAKSYGKSYSSRNLREMRQFYNCFPIWRSVSAKLNWTHYRYLFPIKNKNEKNYYINQVILNNLSSRELINEIKNKSFERLSYADKENIKLITNENNNKLTLNDMLKDPIIINIPSKEDKLDEKVIHKYLIQMLENKFLELGVGFALLGHEYKIKYEDRVYKIDLLFFNYILNSFIVIEIKNREVLPQDVGQLEFYMHWVDKNIKQQLNNKTLGVLIVKKKNQYVIEYISSKELLYLTTFKTKEK